MLKYFLKNLYTRFLHDPLDFYGIKHDDNERRVAIRIVKHNYLNFKLPSPFIYTVLLDTVYDSKIILIINILHTLSTTKKHDIPKTKENRNNILF